MEGKNFFMIDWWDVLDDDKKERHLLRKYRFMKGREAVVEDESKNMVYQFNHVIRKKDLRKMWILRLVDLEEEMVTLYELDH
ncbi:MAG: hypothetical protein V1645_02590 [archaeon]